MNRFGSLIVDGEAHKDKSGGSVVVPFDSLPLLGEGWGEGPERKLQPQRCCGLQPVIRLGIPRKH